MSQLSQPSESSRTANPETQSIPVVNSSLSGASAAKSSAVMAAGTLVSRVLGLLKGILLAAAIGVTTDIANTFSLANTLPTYLYLMIAGGLLNGVLVPQIIKASQKPDRGADYLGRLLSLVLIVLVAITVAMTLGAPWILDATTDLSPAQIELATAFAYWCFPQIFFVGLYAFVGQILNAHNAFGPYTWAPVLNNVIAISVLAVFIGVYGAYTGGAPRTLDTWTTSQTWMLAGGMTLGIVMQGLILLWPLKRLRLGIRLKLGWRGIGLGHAARLAGFSVMTVVIGNLTYLVFTWLASRASREGDPGIAGNAALESANQIYILPHSIVVISLATVLFNRMSRDFARGSVAGVRRTLSYGLRTSAVATIFSAGVMVVVAGQIGMVFTSGAQAQAAILGQIVVLLALGAPLFGANYVMNRVFYAAENARTPFVIQVMLSVVMIAMSLIALWFPPQFIVPWIAITFTVSDVIVVAISHRFLKRQVGDYGAGHILDVHIRICLATLVSAAFGALVLWVLGGYSSEGFAWSSILGALVAIMAVTAVMGVVYLFMLKALRVRELRELLRPVLQRFR